MSAQALTFFSLALIYRRPRPHREFVARVLSRRTGACARFARSATHCTSEPSTSTSTVKPLRISAAVHTKEPVFAAESRDTARVARARALDVESLAVPGDHFGAVPEETALAIAFFRAQR